MSKTTAILLTLFLAAALAGCGGQSDGTPSQTAVSASASTATTEPDYTNTDFSGHWAVSEVYDSTGSSVSAVKLEELGSFALELLTDGTYFVYDADSAVLGQGSYTVNKDVMTLSAGGTQTLYTITDKDTLRGAAADGSVTVLTRQPEETPEIDEEVPDEDTGEGADVSESPEDTEEDIDIPEDDIDIPEDDTTAASTPETSDATSDAA